MSSREAIIRYDGPATAGHKMDIDDIAPALTALAELCKRVNSIANSDRASVRLFISLDVEQHCAEFKLQIVQTLYEQAKAFIDDDRVVAAKTIFEWLGMAAHPFLGLFGLLRLLRGRKPDSITMTVKDGQNVTQIYAGGDVYFAHPKVGELMQDPVVMRKAKDVVRPAAKDGYEKVEFEDNGIVTTTITREDAILIDAMPSFERPRVTATIIPSSTIEAAVKIRKAVYVGTGKWTIQYDKSREVSFEDDALVWLSDFQADLEHAPPGTLLHVRMRVSEINLDGEGDPLEEPTYAIVKVLGVVKPPKQENLFP